MEPVAEKPDSGIDLGLSQAVANVEEAKVKAVMIGQARRVILAIDQTKVEATHFARVCDLDAVDVLIIDEASTFVQELRQANGIRLVVADKVG